MCQFLNEKQGLDEVAVLERLRGGKTESLWKHAEEVEDLNQQMEASYQEAHNYKRMGRELRQSPRRGAHRRCAMAPACKWYCVWHFMQPDNCLQTSIGCYGSLLNTWHLLVIAPAYMRGDIVILANTWPTAAALLRRPLAAALVLLRVTRPTPTRGLHPDGPTRCAVLHLRVRPQLPITPTQLGAAAALAAQPAGISSCASVV